MILISGSKSLKLALKFRIFLKFLTIEGTLVVRVRCDLGLAWLGLGPVRDGLRLLRICSRGENSS